MVRPNLSNNDDEAPGNLTREEVARLRLMLQNEARAVWLWTSIKVWATWIAAVLLGLTMGWDALKRLIASLK